MCMGGGSGSRPPTQGQNQAKLDIDNGVVKPGESNYDMARLASGGFMRGTGYRSPTESLLAPANDSTLLG